jgi:pyruvate dehydrogenase E2 component (dihydrolipoamide acetyltransferase)
MVGRCLQLCVVAIMAGNALSFAPALGKFFRPHSIIMVATTDVTMPALSSTMTEGKIVAWNKKIGEKVSAGDVLLIVESDKADMDVESYEDGYLAAIYTPEGGSAAVGATVAVLVENVADIASVGAKPPSAVTPAAAIPVAAASVAAAPVATPAPAAPTLSSDKYDQVMMPALSSTMTEGKVVSWSKKIGEKISSGDMVLIVESDKADMDVESFEDGYLAAILIGDGESAPVGSPVGLMAKTLADLPAVQAYAAALKSGGAPPVAAAPVAVVAAPAVVVAVQAAGSPAFVPAEGTVNASPQARKLALENNLDVTKIKGTGNFGRVMPDDVLIAAGKKSAVVAAAPVVHAPVAATPIAAASAPAAVKAAPAASKETVVMEGVVVMDGMQKAVAKNMEKTLTVPIFRVSRYLQLYTIFCRNLGRFNKT